MTAEFNDVVKQGYVQMRSKTVGIWQRKFVVLKKPSSKGPLRLEKYNEEKSAWLAYQNTSVKFVDLTSTSDVYRLPSDIRKNSVAIINRDGSSKQIVCYSEQDASDWVQCLREECQLNGTLKDAGDTTGKTDRFNVYLLPAHNLSIYGECVLILTSTHLDLYDVIAPDQKIASWPYTSLRKYGGDSNKFTFESGRHCKTGEGLFVLNTPHGNKIYERVQINSIAIAESYRLAHREDLMKEHHGVERTASLQETSSSSTNGADTPVQYTNSLPSSYRAPQPLPRRQEVETSQSQGQVNYEVPTQNRPQASPPEEEYTLPVTSPPLPPPLRTPGSSHNTESSKHLSEDFVQFLSRRHDSP